MIIPFDINNDVNVGDTLINTLDITYTYYIISKYHEFKVDKIENNNIYLIDCDNFKITITSHEIYIKNFIKKIDLVNAEQKYIKRDLEEYCFRYIGKACKLKYEKFNYSERELTHYCSLNNKQCKPIINCFDYHNEKINDNKIISYLRSLKINNIKND